MLLNSKRVEELRMLLNQQTGGSYTDQQLLAAGLAIARFVLVKELKISQDAEDTK